MDKELEELESELKQLQPRAPSRELADQLDRALGAAPRRRVFRLAWLALPVAAAAVVAFIVVRRPSSQTADLADVASFKPVAAENLFLDAIDEGYTTLADGTPARRIRQSYIDTITWRDSRTNASLTWSLPREEVRVVPVIFQ